MVKKYLQSNIKCIGTYVIGIFTLLEKILKKNAETHSLKKRAKRLSLKTFPQAKKISKRKGVHFRFLLKYRNKDNSMTET